MSARKQLSRHVPTLHRPSSANDLTDLYVGHFRRVRAEVRYQKSTGMPIEVSGEIIVKGHRDQDIFQIEQWRRVALFGAADWEAPYSRVRGRPNLGVLSLVGPFTGRRTTGLTDNPNRVPLLLHYQTPARRPVPPTPAGNVPFPQVDTVMAQLDWSAESRLSSVTLSLKLTADEFEARNLKLVQGISLNLTDLVLQPLGGGVYEPKMHHSLASNCNGPIYTPVKSVWKTTVTHVLPIRFINCTENPAQVVETACNLQIQGVGEAWRSQGALDLQVAASLSKGDSAKYSTVTGGKIAKLIDLCSTDAIEVFVVDKINMKVPCGGGYTLNQGLGGAYIILELQRMNTAEYLLAHELGHVLGLGHPENDECDDCFPGTLGSVMEPEIDSKVNTHHNCAILGDQTTADFTDQYRPLNPKVETTSALDYFRCDF